MVNGHIPLLSDDVSTILDASGVVGDWIHDPGEDRIALSQRLATLLGIDVAAAATGIPMADFLDRMRPVDAARLTFNLERLREAGGPFEARFEALTGSDGPRTVQMRGRIERADAGGTISGRGIAIDVTESLSIDVPHRESQVNLMAEHAIALRHLADALQRPALVRLIDSIMLQIGLELAQMLDPVRSRRGTSG